MRLKTTKDATDACKDALIRRGFEVRVTNARGVWMRLQNKPSEAVHDVWFPRDEYCGDWLVEINKGTAGSKANGCDNWDWSSEIRLTFV